MGTSRYINQHRMQNVRKNKDVYKYALMYTAFTI